MGNRATMINFDGQTPFKILQGATLTIPDYITQQSPTGASSGVSPTTTFNTQRPVVGGQIVFAVNDAAVATQADFTWPVRVGDVIALSAVVSTAVTVSINGIVVYTITTVTTNAFVVGYYG